MDWKMVPPLSVSSNLRQLDRTFTGTERPANVSIQTGEEFVLGFLQERGAFPRSYEPSASSCHIIADAIGSSNLSSDLVDKAVLGVPFMGFKGASEPLTVAGETMLHSRVSGNQGYPRFANKVNKESAENALRNLSGEGSSRGQVHRFPLTDGYSVLAEYGSDASASDSASENSLSGKIKLRCSYGGKMLPRPCDGKLRYAGGDTRIVRIKRNISFQEFMKEMLAVYNQVCLIKYLLPEGDFDELISVSSDDDLQNMMEEWSSSAGEVESSHMPRVFLFSLSDLEYVSLINGHPRYYSSHCNHYVAAINGLAEPGYGTQGLASTTRTYLNDTVTVNSAGERVESHIVSSTSASDMLLPASNELFHTAPPNTAADAAISSKGIQYGILNRQDSNRQFYFENAPHFVFHEPHLLSFMDPLVTGHHMDSRKVTPAEQVNKLSQRSYCPHLKEPLQVGPSQMLLSPHVSDFPAPSCQFKEAHFGEEDIKLDGRPVAAQGDYNTSGWDSENRVHHMNQQHDGVALTGHNTGNNDLHLTKHLGGFPLSIYHKADEVTVASTLNGGTKSLSSEHPKAYRPDPRPPHSVYAGQAHEAEGNHLDDDYGDSYGRVITQQEKIETRYSYFEPTMLPTHIFQSGRIMQAHMDSLARFSKFEDSACSSNLMHVQQWEPIMEPTTGTVHREIFGALRPSSGMDLVLEGIMMHSQQLKTFPGSLTQKAKHEMLEAPSLSQFPEVPVWKEPMVGNHLYDLGESSVESEKSFAEAAHEHTKEGGDAKNEVAFYVEKSSLEHLVTTVSSEHHFVKKEQVHQNAAAHLSETVPNNAYNVSKEHNTEKLDHKISNEAKEGRLEGNSSKEGKARRHVTKNGPPHVKEKKGLLPPPYRPETSDSLQLKEQPFINQKAQTSHLIETKSGSDNASQLEFTSSLCKMLSGLKREKETVNRHFHALVMEEEYAEFSSQMHQPWGVGSAEDDIVNVKAALSPGISPLFFKDSKEELSGTGMMHNSEVGVSLAVNNQESENWSFWRLAQEEFNWKDIPLFDQDTVISSDSVRGCEIETRTCNCMPFQADGMPLHLHIQGHDKTIPEDSPAAIGNEASTLFMGVHPSPNVITDVVDMDTKCASAEDAAHCSYIAGGEAPSGLEPKDGEAEKENDGELRIDLSLEELGIHELQIIKRADLEELRELGSGTFGTVYHGKWKGSDVAIKRIKRSSFFGSSSDQARLIRDFWKEATILSKLQHPNVVTFYGIVKDGPGGTFATVTEYMAHGSLKDVLQQKGRSLDQQKKLKFAMETAFGMEYLHSKNVIHFDLKSDNVLVNLRICKVTDFGMSKIKENTMVSGCMNGTLPWMAPELLNGNCTKVSDKVDVFSFGIVLWEILTGEEPYADIPGGAIIGGIVNNTLRPPVPDGCEPEWRALMEQCWSTDPASRPSFPEIVKRLRMMSEKLGTSGDKSKQ
ncbi:uncharacterized protein LOC116264960 isoform X1 [Nymphaea colorata]|nr:uncharacterized protein LOC116264960 isoform X1 [Nymphaea colorata]XP_031501301.1 uncharacterized protein LOC116264960 isoform X1 [Nymphaea colorata]XP_031501302.1 uncharacterized protein LOC116264960 isoform X1 [Nymphaea colorata]